MGDKRLKIGEAASERATTAPSGQRPGDAADPSSNAQDAHSKDRCLNVNSAKAGKPHPRLSDLRQDEL